MSSDLSKALHSLEGLSTGDAFGELFFTISPHHTSPANLPKTIWPWTDDTHMALSIVEVLKTYGHIEQDALARAFARRYQEEPYRGYGGGGFFYQDMQQVIKEAHLSALITHAHPEGQAGAIAVAVAAAIAAHTPCPSGREFLQEIVKLVPESDTKKGIQTALTIPANELLQAVTVLGSGSKVSAQDTVPFCLWSAAYHLNNYEEALWQTSKGLGDCDTTCAIVGGIVALSAKEIPAAWQKQREPLPVL